MALIIPDYPNPNSKTKPLANAYAWLAGLALDLTTNAGRIALNVNPAEEDWQEPPVAQVAIQLGDWATPPNGDNPGERFATLEELMADPTPVGPTGITFAQAYAAIGWRLYQESVKHPLLKGSTIVL